MQMLRKNDCKQIIIYYPAQTINILIKYYIHGITRLNQEHMDIWMYQNHIRKSHANELLNAPDQEMIHPPHLNYIKGGPPNTGVQQHPINCHQAIQCHASLDPQN
jgi:hypothetical protein